jgi:hypothetical protein
MTPISLIFIVSSWRRGPPSRHKWDTFGDTCLMIGGRPYGYTVPYEQFPFSSRYQFGPGSGQGAGKRPLVS